jgi:hypothetical protein
MTVVNSQAAVQYYPGYTQTQVQQNFTTQVISAISQAYNAIITTVNPHLYVPGLVVTFYIPGMYGMQQINNLKGQILSVTTNTFTVNINSTTFTPFAIPGTLPRSYSYPYAIPNNSGILVPPQPLPYANEAGFEGAIWNAGQPGNLI